MRPCRQDCLIAAFLVFASAAETSSHEAFCPEQACDSEHGGYEETSNQISLLQHSVESLPRNTQKDDSLNTALLVNLGSSVTHASLIERSSSAQHKVQRVAHALSLERIFGMPVPPPEDSEDAGISHLALALQGFSGATWIMIIAAMLLWLVWNVEQVIQLSKTDSREDETMFQNVGFAAAWIVLGISVIMFNKCLFMESGAGFGFPRPILLNWFHMLFTAAFTYTIRIVRPEAMPGFSSLTLGAYSRAVLPVAFVQMVGLSLGNVAYLYLSVSYIQMIKNTTSAFVFGISILMGFEELSSAKAVAVLLVVFGMMLTTSGEQFQLSGLLLQIGATIADSCRLCLTKALMSSKYSVKLDPLSVSCASSLSVLMLLTTPMIVVDYPSVTFAEIWDLRLVLCANALLVVCLNITSMRFMKQVGPTTFALTGVLKDVVLVVALLALFGAATAGVGLEALGFAISLAGLLRYNHMSRPASTKL